MIKYFPMSDVKLEDAYLQNAFQKEIEYLTSFDCDKLLSLFRKTNGLVPKAENYKGWEDTEIRGHSLGHYLKALAQVYATNKDITIYERLQYILGELTLCQSSRGYLSAFPEEYFDRVENNQPIWVPWYTFHKIIAGLISVYELTQIEEAYDIVSKLGDWVYYRTDKWTPETQAQVLSVEYGGMNDCMYELYKLTNNEKHKIAAHKFDEIELFKAIHDGNDILNNRHANTTIPKFIGALNRYMACGESEQFYLDASKAFWTIVTSNHSYVTGGNSEGEHFGQPNILDAERTATNCETCNTYNMLKLTRGLFQITGEAKYLDFYENTFFNAIISSQNPETGMTMYFQPMATGYFKVYSSPFDHFWCCTGTGMENFSKLNDSIYFYDEDKLFVNMYISSTVNWAEKNISIKQSADIPNKTNAEFTIHTDSKANFSICFHIPSWASGVAVKINNEPFSCEVQNGYITIDREFNDNDLIDLDFGIEVNFRDLPDNRNTVAFTYGPLVLSAGLGTEKMDGSKTGVFVQIASKRIEIKDYIVINGQSVEDWKKHIKDNLVRTEGKLEFRLNGTDEDDTLVFTPHFKQHAQRYGIYWTIVQEGSKELNKYVEEKKRKEAIKAAEIDSIQIGNDQYELSHHVDGKFTESGDRDGFHYRSAKPNGWFSYEMSVLSSEDTYLQIKFVTTTDCKSGFDILINDSLLCHQTVDQLPWLEAWTKLYEKTYLIPRDLFGTANKAIVKFKATGEDSTVRIVDVIRTTKKY